MAITKETHLLGSPFKGLHSADLIEEKRAALKGFLAEKRDTLPEATSIHGIALSYVSPNIVSLSTRH